MALREIPLDREFFTRPAPTVARDLIGKLLVRRDEGLAARIVETEAYSQHDPACHAYQRKTLRNAPLYGPPGHAYVYRSYGIHWCLNTATGTDGIAAGVLIRAAQACEGEEVMQARRQNSTARDLLRGPARLTVAFGIDGSFSGADVCAERNPGTRDGVLTYADDGVRPVVASGPRVGVSRAADWPWRFWLRGSRLVSPYSRSPRAPKVNTPYRVAGS